MRVTLLHVALQASRVRWPVPSQRLSWRRLTWNSLIDARDRLVQERGCGIYGGAVRCAIRGR
jgi:hypothetical protein